MDVGVRELRDGLRRWLDAVKRGEEVTITERGMPIARLIGVSSPPSLERLIAEGIVTLRSSRGGKMGLTANSGPAGRSRTWSPTSAGEHIFRDFRAHQGRGDGGGIR